MPVHLFQVRLQGTSGLPEDVYENVLFFNNSNLSIDTAQNTCDSLQAQYNAAGFIAGVKSVEVRAYELGGGQPIAGTGIVAKPVLSVGVPHEIACCLSYAAEDDPDRATAKRRGRIFLGPLGSGIVGGDRPGPSLRAAVLQFGQDLASIGTAGATTWMLHSRVANESYKVESIWVDDAWDVQRRRGLAPTLRSVQDVQ